jgi:hypothetical protein
MEQTFPVCIYFKHQTQETHKNILVLTRILELKFVGLHTANSHRLQTAVTHPAADSTSASKLFADPSVTFSEANFT